MKETEVFICQCYSMEHQLKFWKDEDGLYTEVHLTTHRGFLKRLWYGLKYAFGYKCRFGNFDEFLFKTEDQEKLKKFLNE